MGCPSRQSLPAPPADTLAVVRLHQRSETVVPGPTADDLAFVKANQLPLFVIGEWARPAPLWEVAWVDGAVRFRKIGEVGEIGPWRDCLARVHAPQNGRASCRERVWLSG